MRSGLRDGVRVTLDWISDYIRCNSHIGFIHSKKQLNKQGRFLKLNALGIKRWCTRGTSLDIRLHQMQQLFRFCPMQKTATISLVGWSSSALCSIMNDGMSIVRDKLKRCETYKTCKNSYLNPTCDWDNESITSVLHTDHKMDRARIILTYTALTIIQASFHDDDQASFH